MGITSLFLILLLGVVSFGQDIFGTKNKINRNYWLKHNLVLSGEVKVYPNNIEFEKVDASILHRGEPIKINSIELKKDFSKVVFTAENSKYELLIQIDKVKNFNNSFNLVFSNKPIKESLLRYYCESNMKTKADLLTCYGFPLMVSIEEENKEITETYYYTCWFLNSCISWDELRVKIKNGIIVDYLETI